jgi:hypothetical protein
MLAIVIAVALSGVNATNHPPPSSYVLKGACPFECCTYRDWSVDKQTVLYLKPSVGSKKVGALETGESATGLTGEVHATPVRFTVKRLHDAYNPGDILWVYSYSGEGIFTVWRNGRLVGEDLGFSPYGGTGGNRCEQPSQSCWGTLESELKSNWWVKVKTKGGIVGWSNQPEHFGNKDACG